jgi:hypothetical protein
MKYSGESDITLQLSLQLIREKWHAQRERKSEQVNAESGRAARSSRENSLYCPYNYSLSLKLGLTVTFCCCYKIPEEQINLKEDLFWLMVSVSKTAWSHHCGQVVRQHILTEKKC